MTRKNFDYNQIFNTPFVRPGKKSNWKSNFLGWSDGIFAETKVVEKEERKPLYWLRELAGNKMLAKNGQSTSLSNIFKTKNCPRLLSQTEFGTVKSDKSNQIWKAKVVERNKDEFSVVFHIRRWIGKLWKKGIERRCKHIEWNKRIPVPLQDLFERNGELLEDEHVETFSDDKDKCVQRCTRNNVTKDRIGFSALEAMVFDAATAKSIYQLPSKDNLIALTREKIWTRKWK